MSTMSVSALKQHHEKSAHQVENKTQSVQEGPAKRSPARFPSVDSVIRDIDAKWERLGMVA